MFKRSKEQEKKGSEKREDLLVSFLKDAHFVFAIIVSLSIFVGIIFWRVNPRRCYGSGFSVVSAFSLSASVRA